MSVATLTLSTSSMDGSPLKFSFDTFPSSEGYPSNEGVHEEEELTSPGIDGKRWRTVFDQCPPLIVEDSAPAWTAVASHSAACDLADSMRKAKGRFGVLVVTTGGTRTLFVRVHVSAVRAKVNPGAIVGPGISGAASVSSSWVLDILEFE